MQKNRMIWILILIIIISFAFLFWQFSNFILKKEIIYNNSKVCISNNCFDVELAKTNFQIEKGLMFRDKLDQNKGMLFVFDKEVNYPFWMKNTKIPLDIIWINADKKIVFISENTQPCKTLNCPFINPQKNAKYVLEINGGLCHKLDVKLGDAIDMSI